MATEEFDLWLEKILEEAQRRSSDDTERRGSALDAVDKIESGGRSILQQAAATNDVGTIGLALTRVAGALDALARSVGPQDADLIKDLSEQWRTIGDGFLIEAQPPPIQPSVSWDSKGDSGSSIARRTVQRPHSIQSPGIVGRSLTDNRTNVIRSSVVGRGRGIR